MLISRSDFFLFTGERELRSRIKDLIRYRKNGITKLAGNSFILNFCGSLSFCVMSCVNVSIGNRMGASKIKD